MNHKKDDQALCRGRKRAFAAAFLGCCLMVTGMVAAGDPEPCHTVDVPRLDVVQAIERLARQTGAKIIYPYDLARGRQARPVAGCMTVDQAMAIMLEGSGLATQRTGAGTFTIVNSGSEHAPPEAKGANRRAR